MRKLTGILKAKSMVAQPTSFCRWWGLDYLGLLGNARVLWAIHHNEPHTHTTFQHQEFIMFVNFLAYRSHIVAVVGGNSHWWLLMVIHPHELLSVGFPEWESGLRFTPCAAIGWRAEVYVLNLKISTCACSMLSRDGGTSIADWFP